ncbi:hypothetical protein CBM2629_B110077 [Cupriavidus taiwanensis]|nr:hypothetical protein CBM2629_B110077 [Cupriavidus taiwanensis]
MCTSRPACSSASGSRVADAPARRGQGRLPEKVARFACRYCNHVPAPASRDAYAAACDRAPAAARMAYPLQQVREGPGSGRQPERS